MLLSDIGFPNVEWARKATLGVKPKIFATRADEIAISAKFSAVGYS